MKIADFYPLTFSEIDEQSNPAFAPRQLDANDDPIKVPSLILVREQNQKVAPDPAYNEQVLVLLIDDPANKHDRVTSLGKFWKYSVAKQFCDSFKL